MMFAIQAGIWTIFFGVCGGIYLAYMINANNIDSAYCDNTLLESACNSVDDKVYDNLIYQASYGYTDMDKYTELIDDMKSWDADTIAKGSRFSIVYSLCGITFTMLAATNFCLVVGAWVMQARMTALCCACCLGCV